MKSLRVLAVSGALLAVPHTSQAQNIVFTEDWEIDHTMDGSYVINANASGTHLAFLHFDYSTVGIPPAPHSVGGTTHGLKMTANLDPATPVRGGVSVSPVNFGITENFELRFDAWFNFNGPAPGGGSGSTQVGGAGYGTAATAVQFPGVADCVYIGGSGDGGTTADYRVYSPSHPSSYQDGDFRIGSDGVGQTTPGDPNSGYVYAATNRNASAPYYVANFPGQSPPAAQTALFPQQTGTAQNGSLGFKWHDVSLKKTGNVITYSINGVLIATVDVTDAGTLAGTNILFNHYDINATVSTDPNRTNLTFTLIDNVVVTEYTNIVEVTATTPLASEAGPTAGIFTVTRTAAGQPLTVNYTLTGTASDGSDYVSLPGSVTFQAADTSKEIMVTPIDDGTAEISETVVLTIAPALEYVGGGSSASISIADNEPPTLSITNVSKQMYERANDYGTFRITRLGNTNVASFNANLGFAGTATFGVDFNTSQVVAIDPGVQSTNFNVLPAQDALYEGNEIVSVGIGAAGAGEYTIGAPSSASITLVDGNEPPETVLFSDNFNMDSSANWNLFFASTNPPSADYTAIFAFDYSSQNIPPAPNGGGDTLGLFLQLNKTTFTNAAALNLYPIGQNFSGNYALKFNMFLSMKPGASSTEHALFGINHSGNRTNWWRSGGVPAGWVFDGLFYAVENDAQATTADYILYSSPTTAGNNPTNLTAGANASAFVDAFKSPPWAVAGGPALNLTNNTPVWSDVEVSKIGNVVSLRINHTPIFSYTNTTAYTSGNIMLGYNDAFNSIGPIECFIVYDNVRVVRLDGLEITNITDLGADVQLDFTFDLNDVPSSFKVQSSAVVTGTYTDATATIVQLSPGTYRATVTKSGDAQFYRIRHL